MQWPDDRCAANWDGNKLGADFGLEDSEARDLGIASFTSLYSGIFGRRLNPASLKCPSNAKAAPIFSRCISSKLVQSVKLHPLTLPVLNVLVAW